MDRIREFIDEYLYQILIGLVAIIVIFMFVIGGMLVGKGDDVSSADDQVAIENSSSQSEAASVSQSASSEQPKQVAAGSNQQMYVDVKGAVKNPGVYQVSANMRVVDAIDLAGGYNRSADKKKINLAQKLTDQQVIYVPIRGEKGTPVTSTVAASPTPAETTPDASADSAAPAADGATGTPQQINLNTADKTKLQELTGIGDKKADQIIAYRQAHGQFKNIEELKDVPGFGDKTFANLKSSICV
ncbi:ComEA family DNA-binding protein [Lentilactobacillus otakiensis]|uniref:Competence protein ComEA n=1 Tax=Lentilactobacillus otakiensis DSM 19908 = JCM 15040 TaxID=1423780 RepID=S4NES9_9LACO|nr:ComEA family DNA-binding protein [Lentilactobacillus otakiensis]KRL08600.1 competence protein ComEA [Lentilactobacillus otakiensis DSM 19908 = JCM 15040]MBZ3777617.1 ComEA family DNA-binding protein [Lentilactobacillus otakiensis]MDV3518704.1 ComEA family DNA-binding protein [Lentilactobacillus otakiensis]GAD17464.1 competence protein ComEA [Lentilactobacillus otakiensis DSM 19908 = JCM 15040]